MRLSIFLLILFNIINISGCALSPAKKGVMQDQGVYSWDFGRVKAGDILEHLFVLENDSADILRITNISTSCSCTTSELEKKELLSGESVDIIIRFNTQGYYGKSRQFVYINTDRKNRPVIKITLTADVEGGAGMQFKDFGLVQQGDIVEHTFMLDNDVYTPKTPI